MVRAFVELKKINGTQEANVGLQEVIIPMKSQYWTFEFKWETIYFFWI